MRRRDETPSECLRISQVIVVISPGFYSAHITKQKHEYLRYGDRSRKRSETAGARQVTIPSVTGVAEGDLVLARHLTAGITAARELISERVS